MISYEIWCQIRDYRDRQHMTLGQIAAALHVHHRTVASWVAMEHYAPRKPVARASVLDPFKGLVTRLLDSHPLSAQQVFQRLREEGYGGGYTTVKDYVRRIRPKHRPAFLKLAFAPGEAAQVDWGSWGTIGVGKTRRQLSFFVMVLCHSRRMYLEFFVAQTMEHFLAAHEHAFAAFGAVPTRIMIDNLKTGVLQHLAGCAPIFNQRYLDYSRHCVFTISACNVRSGWEKGRVENAVGYVKKNFLNGLVLGDFNAINPAAQLWLDSIANVRIHGATGQRPIDLFEQEKAHLRPLNLATYDIARIDTARVSKQFRVAFDANHYSVPVHYVGVVVTLKAYPDRLCIYHAEQLIAWHVRSYDRRQDIEDPDHPKVLVEQRKHANAQRLLLRFLALTPKAGDYHEGLMTRRLNWRNHVAKINALAAIYGDADTGRAIEDALAFDAFSCEYITNLLEARARKLPEASPLQLTRRQDLLELEIAAPDLSLYELRSYENQTKREK
jgi:transposase